MVALNLFSCSGVRILDLETLRRPDLALHDASIERHVAVREAIVIGAVATMGEETPDCVRAFHRALLRLGLDARRLFGDGDLGRWDADDVRALVDDWLVEANADGARRPAASMLATAVGLLDEHGLLDPASLDEDGVRDVADDLFDPAERDAIVVIDDEEELVDLLPAWPFPLDPSRCAALPGQPLADVVALEAACDGGLEAWLDRVTEQVDDLRGHGTVPHLATAALFGGLLLVYGEVPDTAAERWREIGVDFVNSRLHNTDVAVATAWVKIARDELVALGVVRLTETLELTSLGRHRFVACCSAPASSPASTASSRAPTPKAC